MEILQYICLHIKYSITQIVHYNTFYFLRGSELSGYEIELPNRVTQNDVTLGVTNLKLL